MINTSHYHYNNSPQLSAERRLEKKPKGQDIEMSNCNDSDLNAKKQLSFKGGNVQAAKEGVTLFERVVCSKFSRTVFDLADKNRCMLEAGIATALGMTLRPAAIWVTPGQKTEDKQYSVVKSIATAVVGFVFALAVYSQVGNVSKAIAENKDLLNKFKEKGDDLINSLKEGLKEGSKKLSKDDVLKGFIKQNEEYLEENLFKPMIKENKFNPFKTIDELFEHLKDSKVKENLVNTILEKLDDNKFKDAIIEKTAKNRIDQYNKLFNQITKYIVAIPEAFFLYKLVPPLINKMFPNKDVKGKQPQSVKPEVNKMQNNGKSDLKTTDLKANSLLSVYNHTNKATGGNL